MRRSTAGRLVVLVLALSLTGACGGDDDTATPAAQPTSAAPTASPDGDQKIGKECAPAVANEDDLKSKPEVTVPAGGAAPSGLVTTDLVEGKGAEAKAGAQISVQYVGVGCTSGEEFDASWNRGEPFSFSLGQGQVISGWDQGFEGMKVGGRRLLVIPPDLGYGPAGSPPVIGPDEPLVFVVDLVDVG